MKLTAVASVVLMILLPHVDRGISATDQSPQQAPQITATSAELERRDQPVTNDDLRILQRADELLKDESVWNRKDDRECDDDEATGKRSLFCALQRACIDVLGAYDHRRVALQEVRFAVEDATRGQDFEHRLRDFNNLPTTQLADIKKVLRVATLRVQARVRSTAALSRPRGRDLGIPFPGQTGPLNAITDVAGIAVGHVTLIEGEGKLIPGKGPIRTGVTAILPRPRGNWDPVFAATFNQNGNGDMTGINWIKESGFLEGPILLTGTHSVGTVRDAAIQWQLKNGRQFIFTYPIVAETFDFLNDANGEHVKASHAIAALDAAKPGPVEEGAVGGGTGMGCNGFKGGIGTASRVLANAQGGYTVGILVQCNYGGDLRILGVPIRTEITDLRTCTTLPQPLSRPWTANMPACPAGGGAGAADDGSIAEHEGRGSIIVIVATNAPLLPHQLERIARRVSLGLGRLGSFAGNSSGDLFLAFSTANPGAAKPDGTPALVMLPNDRIDPLFQATIDATEEAVVNAMLAAQTMTGADGIRVFGLPGDRVVAALKKYNRMK